MPHTPYPLPRRFSTCGPSRQWPVRQRPGAVTGHLLMARDPYCPGKSRKSINRYLSFCTANQLQPIPLSEATLCQFVTELANSSLKHQSIKCYLSGIRLLQISAGLDDPFTHTMPRLKLVLRGVKHHQPECGTNSRRRLPITPSIIRSLHSYWLSSDTGHDVPMLWAACCLCFFSFLQSGKTYTPSDSSYDPSCHLSPGYISSNNPFNPSVLWVNIKQSKTDPRGIHYCWRRHR